jgi:hypothetical protein
VRGTTNGNARGSSRDRAARRRWLLKAFESDLSGYCRCYRCGVLLSDGIPQPSYFQVEELRRFLTVDRIVPGCKGGRYVRGNIRPACAECNSEQGGALRRST